MDNKIEVASIGGGSKRKNIEMKRLPLFVVLSLFIIPMIIIAAYLCVREFNNQTRTAMDRRESMANLGALLIHEKFDGIIEVALSLSTRPLVYQNIEKGDYAAVAKNLQDISKVLPSVDSIGVLDKEGVLKASIPPTPEVVGQSFAYRDFYKGVSKEWKPYVSEVFRRSVDPMYNVVSVAVPVWSHDQKILGILVLSTKVESVADWSSETGINSSGYFVVIDKNGKLVAHPQMKSGDLVDFSSTAVWQNLLKGERGVGIFLDPVDNDKDLVAYAPVRDYGFGVIVAQPTDVAFAKRKNQLIEFILFWTIIIFSASGFLYRVLKDRITLKAQRDHEATLLESIGDGVVAIDRDWNITLWNKAASVITGWSKEEAVGKPLRSIVKLLRERDRAENITFVEEAMVHKRVMSMADGTLLVRKDGSEISVGDSAAPIFGEKETPIGVIIVFRDTSLVVEKSRLRSDIAYATHQLRTPVTEALWNLEIGINEEDADKRKEDLRVAHQALLSVKKLSEHLVFVSEIDQGEILVKLSPTRFIDVLSEVHGKIKKEAELRGVPVSIAPISPLIAINTDKKLLGRALFEIIENAVIYSPRGSKVEIATTVKEKEFLIEVIDAGFGIVEEEQPIIFTKFFRGSNRGAGNAGGGLGLYLSKQYVALLGGKIWFESVEGKGTTFYVSIPIA